LKRKKNQKRAHPKPRQIGYSGVIPKLSLCMIVKNESKTLVGCIDSVKSAMDEIVVVDTGSTDNTKEIARWRGAQVFDFPWCDDFSAARNESIRRATGDYILWLDADDRMDEIEVQKLRLLKETLPPQKNRAYYLVVNNQSPLDGETRFHHMRLFPRIPGAYFEGRVHEQIFHRLNNLRIESVQTDIIIRHTGYHDMEAVQRKSERNLQIILKELETAPDHPLYNFNAARTLAAMGRLTEAVACMKKVMANKNMAGQERRFFLLARLLLGKFHMDLNQGEQAVPIFRDLSHSFPEDGLVHFCLGESLFMMNDYPAAREALRNSLRYPTEVGLFPINLDKNRYYQQSLLYQCYLETGETEKAEALMSQNPDLRGHNAEILQARALSSLKSHQFQAAVDYYEKAIQEGGSSDNNYANLGLAYRKLGRNGEAEKAFCCALEINPLNRECLNNLGHLYHEKKNYPKTIETFKKTLALAPDQVNARLALSDVYFRTDEVEPLVGECEALLIEMALPCDQTLNSLAELGILYETIGDELVRQGRMDLALMAFQVSFLVSPSAKILEKTIALAVSCGNLKGCLDHIGDTLEFYGQDSPTIAPIANFIDNFSKRAAVGGPQA
jgi:glycosyltransferase involved in cell wall biosynthesis